MPYIYRYTDLSDGIIKYVGIVYGATRTLEDRLLEHTHDDWYATSKWKIEYIEEGIDTEAEARSFETHYINLYDTGRYYNKACVGQGTNKYLPNRDNDWVVFDGENLENFKEIIKEQRELTTVIKDLNIVERTINDAQEVIYKNQKLIEKLCREIESQKYKIDIELQLLGKKRRELIKESYEIANFDLHYIKQRQAEGIGAMPIVNGKKVSIRTGNPIGRPPVTCPENWDEVIQRWKNKELTAVEAMHILGMKRTSFYKLVKYNQLSQDKGEN